MRPIGALLLTLGLVAAAACSQAATPVSPTPSTTPQPTASPTPTEAASTATPALDPSSATPTPTQDTSYSDLQIITLLPYDAIPAILKPRFVTGEEARKRYEEKELVLGVSINGDHRAYSVPYLSSREIVNDVVGGVPIAVTW